MAQLQFDNSAALAEKIAADAGVTLSDCYQCGKCSAGCPMSAAMDIQPRQAVRFLQLGMAQELLRSRMIWLCASCHMCVDRCPNDVDLPALIENARYEAQRVKLCAVPEVGKFNDIFMENVKNFGKSQEVILEGAYNLLSGNLLQDMGSVPHMLRHGIVGPEIHTVREREHVRRMLTEAEKEDEGC